MADANARSLGNVTVVTAFFDIGWDGWQESSRTPDQYFAWFDNLLQLANPMVVFTSPDLAERVADAHLGAGRGQPLRVVPIESHRAGHERLLEALRRGMAAPELHAFYMNPGMSVHIRPEYILLASLKAEFVLRAVEAGAIGTELAAWIDFGYVREIGTLPIAREWHVAMDPARIHAFSLWPLDADVPMFEIMRRCERLVFTGVIVGGVGAWRRLAPLWGRMMWSMLACGIADDEQMALMMAIREEPELFEVHLSDWFGVLRKFAVPPEVRQPAIHETEG